MRSSAWRRQTRPDRSPEYLPATRCPVVGAAGAGRAESDRGGRYRRARRTRCPGGAHPPAAPDRPAGRRRPERPRDRRPAVPVPAHGQLAPVPVLPQARGGQPPPATRRDRPSHPCSQPGSAVSLRIPAATFQPQTQPCERPHGRWASQRRRPSMNITRVAAAAIVALAGLVIPPSQIGPAGAAEAGAAGGGPKPTIVLEHGAWADTSSWNGVIRRLQADGYTVYAPPNPLQSLPYDSAYLAAFPPAQGQTLAQLLASTPGSCAVPANLNVVPFPGAPAGVGEAYIKQSVFPSCMADGLPATAAPVLAPTQLPIATIALTQPTGVPAWQTIPSWAVVGTADHAIPLALQLAMANTAHAHITRVDAPHLSMISNPGTVTNVILQAVRATS